jgi:hypothetical protein
VFYAKCKSAIRTTPRITSGFELEAELQKLGTHASGEATIPQTVPLGRRTFLISARFQLFWQV